MAECSQLRGLRVAGFPARPTRPRNPAPCLPSRAGFCALPDEESLPLSACSACWKGWQVCVRVRLIRGNASRLGAPAAVAVTVDIPFACPLKFRSCSACTVPCHRTSIFFLFPVFDYRRTNGFCGESYDVPLAVAGRSKDVTAHGRGTPTCLIVAVDGSCKIIDCTRTRNSVQRPHR